MHPCINFVLDQKNKIVTNLNDDVRSIHLLMHSDTVNGADLLTACSQEIAQKIDGC